jgi:deoxyribose-phosphate aldolase
MEHIFKNYRTELNYAEIQDNTNKALKNTAEFTTKNFKQQLLSFIDLTFLNVTDFAQGIGKVTRQVNHIKPMFGIKNVACIMVYPRFVPIVKNNLTDEDVAIAAVVGDFPSSQTFLEVKKLETQMVFDSGAQEADMVISVGEFLDKRYDLVYKEISELKKIAGDKVLKVILETGVLKDFELIYKASILAMEAGADFIKTSTGKEKLGATPEAVYVMSLAAKDFYLKTGKKVGIKPAGGVSSIDAAAQYLSIVNQVLGSEWITPKLFRIGSSSLANKVLLDLELTNSTFFNVSSGY